MRHSRRVRMLRVAIPAAVVSVGLAALVAATLFDPLRALTKLPIDIGGLVVSGTKITMQAPRIAGFTHDSRPYEVTARAAAQDFTNPDSIELQDIRAKMEIANRTTVELAASTGLFDTKSEKLTLRQNIVVTSSTGYEGRLSEAVIDIRTGSVISNRPVYLKLLNGNLDANRLEIAESGDLMRFDNGVTMNLNTDGDSGRGGGREIP
jgi:lipopolysaccharide export system protein LptC